VQFIEDFWEIVTSYGLQKYFPQAGCPQEMQALRKIIMHTSDEPLRILSTGQKSDWRQQGKRSMDKKMKRETRRGERERAEQLQQKQGEGQVARSRVLGQWQRPANNEQYRNG
jgi:hypothetical protein